MSRPGLTVAVVVGGFVLVGAAFAVAWQSKNLASQAETSAKKETVSSPEVRSAQSAQVSVPRKETTELSDTYKVPPVPQPPKATSSPGTNATVDALIARNDDTSGKKLLEMHETGDDITRREIERHASDKNARLKKAIVDESVKALDSKETGSRTKALETLRFLADASGVTKAIQLLSENEKPEVVAGSINYLGRVNNIDGFEKVLLLAKTSQDVGVRATAIRNLVLTGGKAHPAETVAVLEEALSSSDISIQAEALRALGHFPQNINPEGKKRIAELAEIGATDKKKEEVRDTARMLLTLIEDVKGIGAE